MSMPNYWKIRAGEKGFHWKSWKAKTRARKGIITIGWNIGKLEELSLEETPLQRKSPSYLMKAKVEDDPVMASEMICSKRLLT